MVGLIRIWTLPAFERRRADGLAWATAPCEEPAPGLASRPVRRTGGVPDRRGTTVRAGGFGKDATDGAGATVLPRLAGALAFAS